MCQETWEDLGMSCRMYLALKMSDSSRDLVVSIVGAFCGRKWIRRIASVWRAKLSGESELSVTDVLRVGATRGSRHVCPGKLNRPPLPFGGRIRMWDIRRSQNVGRIPMWDIRRRRNVGRIELRLWDIRVECWRRRIPDVRCPGGMSDDFRPGGMSYATRRKWDICVSKRKEATWQFLGRIPYSLKATLQRI